jgi:dTDP-4-dehydrorhamnose 3,5-epimerase
MDITDTLLLGVKIIKPKVFEDERGFFFESFNQLKFNAAIGRDVTFVQDNHSRSKMGVLRGLHYQITPYEQGKLVRVVSGEVFDVAVDIRHNSPTFGQWHGELLSEDNKVQLWIPEGFAHGFLVLSPTAEFLYKTTNYWHPQEERTIQWNDPDINILWPPLESYILSKKDQNGSSLKKS